MARHWAVTEEAGALLGMRILVWLYRHLGRRAFSVALVPVMAYFYLRRGEARRASRAYLARVRRCYPDALGHASLARLSFRQFMTFGESLLDKYRAWAETPSGITMDPAEEKMLFDATRSARGCLLIGSHFGNLEYSRGIAHRHPGLVVNVLTYDQHARKFARLISGSDPESRMNLIQVTDLDFELALRLRARVDQGEWVVMAGDRVPVGGGSRVCRAVFFGDEAPFPIGPYVLASLLRCPVYLLHCCRRGDEYWLGMEHFADEIELPRRDRDQAFRACAQKFASALERQVARAPLQWFNFFDFWDYRPPPGRPTRSSGRQ